MGWFVNLMTRWAGVRPLQFFFAEAQYAIDATPKQLRKWLENEEVRLISEPAPGWRRFSPEDILVIGIMRRLITFGVGVVDANVIALGTVRELIVRRKHIGKPMSLRVFYSGDEMRTRLEPIETPSADLGDAVLTINLGDLMKIVIERAMRARRERLGQDDDVAEEHVEA